MDYKKKYLKYKLKYLNIRKLYGGAESRVGDKRKINEILTTDLFQAIENNNAEGVKTVLEQDPELVDIEYRGTGRTKNGDGGRYICR